MNQFIEIYENALDRDFCERCIKKFGSSAEQHKGQTGHGVDPIKKNSTDITITQSQQWQEEVAHLQGVVLGGLIQYVRKYPFALVGSIALQVQTPDGVEQISYVDIPKLNDESLARLIQTVFRLGSINIQKYDQNEGGYFYYHSEIYPHPSDPQNDALHRKLLWMFYLNDVDEGGETEFFHQKVVAKPKLGSLVIAPAGFTHTHRGNMPVSNDKYIFTSWVLYQRSEHLYGEHGGQ
ncbi:2OG-Fe(II) oxygenase [Marinicella sp. S1101]|uniref:2OG-Fe(II) oxygenase n=1 Tax=Marinicella marina TaxID=2996016 RepID=UPI002260CE20|nr:2OG-Fe(II) oxygenase [Marinicella marina]MCX7553961.1 2OG-Fe(II) oxygenase [Marinicella marina]MDJ1140453.1 2OG-Fe(II) oxygenase [Marinicella marina]